MSEQGQQSFNGGQHPAAGYGGSAGDPYGAGAQPGPRKGAGMKKAGGWMSIIGAVILVLSVVGGVIMGVIGGKALASLGSQIQQMQATQTVTLHEGEIRLLLQQGSGSQPTCELQALPGSAGQAELTSTSAEYSNLSVPVSGTEYSAFSQITVSQTGEFRLSCQSTAPSQVLMTQDISGLVGSTLLLGGGVLLGFLSGGLGFLMLIIGLILFLVGRSKLRG